MTQVLTVSCKLKVSESQVAKWDATLPAFGQALNWLNQNTPEKVVNPLKRQSLGYHEIRTRFALSSNLAQQVCKRVAGARKVAQQKPPVKAFKAGFVTYDARSFSFRDKDWTLSLPTVEGRERFELAIGHYQRGQLAGSNPQSAPLVKRRDGSSKVVVVVPPAYSLPSCHRCLGLDQGEGKRFRWFNSACGGEGDADLNGANVIALWGAVVNPPTSPRLRGDRGGAVVGLPPPGLQFAPAGRRP